MLLVIDTNILVNVLKSHDNNAKSVLLMRDVCFGKHVMMTAFKSHLSRVDQPP